MNWPNLDAIFPSAEIDPSSIESGFVKSSPNSLFSEESSHYRMHVVPLTSPLDTVLICEQQSVYKNLKFL